MFCQHKEKPSETQTRIKKMVARVCILTSSVYFKQIMKVLEILKCISDYLLPQVSTDVNLRPNSGKFFFTITLPRKL